MTYNRKLEEIKLPFASIRVVSLDGPSAKLSNIPDFVVRLLCNVHNRTKEPEAKDIAVEYGLSFDNIQDVPSYLEDSVKDYIKSGMIFHLLGLNGPIENFDNRLITTDLTHGSMDRIMTILKKKHLPAPLKMSFDEHMRPTFEFGIGRDIMVVIQPAGRGFVLTTNSVFGFPMPDKDEPIMKGSAVISDAGYNISVWRSYGNKIFQRHVVKEIIVSEILHVLKYHDDLIPILKGVEKLEMNPTDESLAAWGDNDR